MEDHRTVYRRLKEQVEKSKYQKDLHSSDEDSESSIRTHFLNMKRKETWTYRNNLKLDCLGDISNPEFLTYKVKNLPYHGLTQTVLMQRFPEIIAEPGFEICWCPNPGSNIVRNCSFKVNDVEWQNLNSRYFDDYFQKISTDEDLNRDIGNVPSMQYWNTHLPAYDTYFWIPWFYSLHTSKMFPLYRCGKEDNIIHEVNLRRYIGELLIVRREDTKELVKFDEGCIRVVGNNNLTGSPYTLPVPEMRGDYIFMSDMECEHNRCEETNNKYGSLVFDIDTVKSIDSDNIHKLNTTVNMKIKDMPFPVHTIHWKAVNLTAENYNYLSNYTTNFSNHVGGGCPIKWISLSSQNGLIFKNQEFFVGERIVSKMNFNKTPALPGYGCWTNAPDAANCLYPKPGVNLDDSELTFRLENNNENCDDSFRINAQVVYNFRITIKDYPKNETERNIKGIDFEISGDQ